VAYLAQAGFVPQLREEVAVDTVNVPQPTNHRACADCASGMGVRCLAQSDTYSN
jgi:hypothetical protein